MLSLCEFLESNGNAKSCTPAVIVQWEVTILFIHSCLFTEEGMHLPTPVYVCVTCVRVCSCVRVCVHACVHAHSINVHIIIYATIMLG